jgi:nitroimidazol reductase NimA-like FMN-containing flavoprotein (pyridoxamine 5'-phosphate oxidase superfamily)/GNAT superfamily N-acetyltransferase
MRRAQHFAMSEEEAMAFLAAAQVVHFAAVGDDGQPILRTVNAVVVDGAVAFHGAPIGEKVEALGRSVVLAAEETVTTVPSYFLDAERACPATTLYRSVQVHGVLQAVDDPPRKARVLQALMEKLQPEGGHAPVRHDDRLYEKAIKGLLIAEVRPTRVDGKAKLAQNRRPEEVAHIVEQLWRRGAPGDARAVDLIRAANPDAPTPPFLAAPDGARLVCAPGNAQLTEVAALLRDAYWQVGATPEAIIAAHRGATAWVTAVDATGSLVASARAISDGTKWAGIFDVMVAPAWRGRGLGEAVVRLLLDHPSVRGARRVWLATRDGQPFYARLGFAPGAMLPVRDFVASEMVLTRA